MNTDGTGFNTYKECHKNESLWNHTTTDHKEGEQLEDRRNAGESTCNFGEGMDQRVQSLMFMMMMINRLNWKRVFLNSSRQTSGISAAQTEYMSSRFILPICLFVLFAFTLDDLRLFCQFDCIHTIWHRYVEPGLQIRSNRFFPYPN